MTPRRLFPGEDCRPVLALIRAAFADMDGRIDPPSSVHRLTEDGVARQAAEGEVWVIGKAAAPVAAVFLTPKPGRLHLGKLAVAEGWRGRGLAGRLVALAEARARALGLPALELESRVELTGNHAAFGAMGFAQTGSRAHPGYDRPTCLIFSRPVPSG